MQTFIVNETKTRVRFERLGIPSSIARYDAWADGRNLGRATKVRTRRCFDQWEFWSIPLRRRFYGETRTDAVLAALKAEAAAEVKA